MEENTIYALVGEIRRLTRSTLMHQYAIARRIGLNVTDAECLDYLMEQGDCTAGQLAEITQLTTGAITTAIDRLERKGFVKRYRDGQDRRKVFVAINPDKDLGEAKIQYQHLGMAVLSSLNDYTAEELGLIERFLTDLTQIYAGQTAEITKQTIAIHPID